MYIYLQISKPKAMIIWLKNNIMLVYLRTLNFKMKSLVQTFPLLKISEFLNLFVHTFASILVHAKNILFYPTKIGN